MDYKKLFDLTGKVCIITGGSGHLGAENIKALKDFGATVISADMVEKETVADEFFKCDIASTDSFKELFSYVNEKYGKIDVLINSAAFVRSTGIHRQLEHMTDELWQLGIDGTLSSVFRAIREVTPYMKENGGSIINYSSMYGVVAPDMKIYGDQPEQTSPPNYGAAKAGVIQLTRYAASALAKYGIRVNSVTPGPFPNTAHSQNEGFNKSLASKTMLGRFGKNTEMAGAVLLLASDASTFMTGSNIVVDGGWTAW